jgi:phosphatidylglycerophosphate synthase
MITGNENHDNHILLWSSIMLNILANLDRTNITFGLGVIVSILAIINYVIQIKKNLKRKK